MRVRASRSKQAIRRYHLSAGHEPQKFGRGMKETREIDPKKHHPGRVVDTMGWPPGANAGGRGDGYGEGGGGPNQPDM